MNWRSRNNAVMDSLEFDEFFDRAIDEEILDAAIEEAITDLLTSSSASNKPMLRRGSRGSTVVELPKLLTKAGFSQQADGIFGSNTAAAVRAFQRSRGLSVNGIVGPNTWPALLGISGITAVTPKPKTYFKDDPSLKTVSLKPTTPIEISPRWSKTRKAIASLYNRLGGLVQRLANKVGIETATVLAVWKVESGGRRHTPHQAIIRFENHKLYRLWGRGNQKIYNQYFRHGGNAGQPGKSWENHKFRENLGSPWEKLHDLKKTLKQNQALEYRALALAKKLAGEKTALMCISIGGPQILISNYNLLGYPSPREMYDAFQASERFHVLGFFDYCRNYKRNLIPFLRNHQWREFTHYYNGPGQVELYSKWIRQSYQEALRLPL